MRYVIAFVLALWLVFCFTLKVKAAEANKPTIWRSALACQSLASTDAVIAADKISEDARIEALKGFFASGECARRPLAFIPHKVVRQFIGSGTEDGTIYVLESDFLTCDVDESAHSAQCTNTHKTIYVFSDESIGQPT